MRGEAKEAAETMGTRGWAERDLFLKLFFKKIGVGMSLEPSSDPGSDCHVSSIKDGGALANDGRVKPGDKLVRVDGFDCMGVPRAVIKSRVLGPPNSERFTGDTETAMGTVGVQKNLKISSEALISTSR
jgi:C-terminal processing protease CtpA/Prc